MGVMVCGSMVGRECTVRAAVGRLEVSSIKYAIYITNVPRQSRIRENVRHEHQ
jgi:hypothetical protein